MNDPEIKSAKILRSGLIIAAVVGVIGSVVTVFVQRCNDSGLVPLVPETPWDGQWAYTQTIRNGESTGILQFESAGDSKVVGKASKDTKLSSSTLDGNVSEDGLTLEGSWANPNTNQSGQFRMKLSDDLYKFTGRYSIGIATPDNPENQWNGERAK